MTTTSAAPAPPQDSAEARERLVDALHADLVGPFAPDADTEEGGEVLPLPPSRWYLTGFLANAGDRAPEEDEQEVQDEDPSLDDADLGAGDDVESDDDSDPDPEPKRRGFFPSSVGMSLLLPPESGGGAPDRLAVTVSWADYVRQEVDKDDEDKEKWPSFVWQRQAPRTETVEVVLDGEHLTQAVPDSRGLRVEAFIKESHAPGIPPGTRAVALFLVNGRSAATKPGYRDEAYAFQVGMKVVSSAGLIPRPDLRDAASEDWESRVSDVQFRNVLEWAVGHGVAVESDGDDERHRVVRISWLPRSTVHRVEHRSETKTETRMEVLAEATSGAELKAALAPLAEEYETWIEEQAAQDVTSGAGVETARRRSETQGHLVREARRARGRIARGIERLAADPVVREAFQRANRAIATASRKRYAWRYEGGSEPRWRLFQLAFILLNVESIGDDTHPDREEVELIFFPTGGGKTEAYLGVIAYTLVLRRLRGQSRPDQGLGVAVLLRYTLRLLTLDQLGRAATMVCALELQRRDAGKAAGEGSNPLGDGRFSIGLWVGRSATANTISQVAKDMVKFEGNKASVFPLTECPWCQKAIESRSVQLKPSAKDPEEVVVSCGNWKCEFCERKDKAGLPVLFVDEQIYRELPSFIVATVDKYAMTPWRGEVGMLFGRATHRRGERFYGAMDSRIPGDAEPLPDMLPPPELIVQDELHLISGPLGTMTGLFETAIEHLTRYRGEDGKLRMPKILASTATVREASSHVKALFGRSRMSIFPPRGIDANETFFSTVARDDPGRDYVGVAASGRRMKQVLIRTYVALLAGGGRWFKPRGKTGQTVDPYMTLVGYFNSLRELGGMRRLVEDEVRSRCLRYGERMPLDHEGDNPHMGNRKLDMPVELTSRESTERIARTKERLHHDRADKGIDVLLASNMISVGVDIDRLGLMVMAGQPKTTSEYIQSTSRVGRDANRPGLVVTCLNLYKARDRSHYEHFRTYHAAFYRRVEAGSLTPFSGPALDRGLAAVLVAMFRHWKPELTAPEKAMKVSEYRATVGNQVVEAIVRRAKGTMRQVSQDEAEEMAQTLRERLGKLLDTWEGLVEAAIEGAGERQYSTMDRGSQGRPLLLTPNDVLRASEPGGQPASKMDRRFLAPTSMRDVEPEVHVFVDRKPPEEEATHG
ncbi:MAG: DISARM system helicase DrmA [Myxococcota bacterium]